THLPHKTYTTPWSTQPLSTNPPFFFFSSRRRHTRWPRDWSSDVCSSDLLPGQDASRLSKLSSRIETVVGDLQNPADCTRFCEGRSEERRVGKECRSRGWQEH